MKTDLLREGGTYNWRSETGDFKVTYTGQKTRGTKRDTLYQFWSEKVAPRLFKDEVEIEITDY